MPRGTADIVLTCRVKGITKTTVITWEDSTGNIFGNDEDYSVETDAIVIDNEQVRLTSLTFLWLLIGSLASRVTNHDMLLVAGKQTNNQHSK